MDIFVVNSMDSAFQLIFTFASLPIVLIPGFGSIPFNEYAPTCINTATSLTIVLDCRNILPMQVFASRGLTTTLAMIAAVRRHSNSTRHGSYSRRRALGIAAVHACEPELEYLAAHSR